MLAPSARPTRAGFTLVELMVVIIILGMIGGVAVVSWEALLPNQRFNKAVRRLSEVLHRTRSDAIALSREFRIYYNLDENTYRVRTPFLAGGGIATPSDLANLEAGDFHWTDEFDADLQAAGIDILEVVIDDNAYYDGEVFVRFDPLGASSFHTVTLHQELFDRTFTIEAMPLTGDIRFHDGVFKREPAQEGDFD